MRLHRLSLCVCCALVACSSPTTEQSTVAPEEVLERSTRAVQELESAQYVVQADFDLKTDALSALGTARMDGMLSDGGEQLRFQLDLTSEVASAAGDSSLSGTVEVVVISENEVYLNLHSLSSQPSSEFFRPEMIAALAGKWWLLSEDNSPPITKSVTPDPRLLQAQAQVVSVARDRGIVQINGRDSHHYDVALDTEKLAAYLEAIALEKGQEFDKTKTTKSLEEIQGSGQLWIDAETYFVQKINWVVQSVPLDNGGTASLSFTVTFRNHNDAPAILPPQGATPFSPAIFFTLPSEAMFPEEIQNQLPSDLNDEQLLELLQEMNSY